MRVVIVTRRFWPLVGDVETFLGRMAQELKEQGAAPLVLTSCRESHWPTRMVYREVPVIRVHESAGRGWGAYRYLRGVSRWLRRNPIDLIYVSALKHEAYAALGAGRSRGVPVVLRAEQGGERGDCRWQEESRFGRRIRRRCRTAGAIVCPDVRIREELSVAGYPPDRLRVIPDGTVPAPPRSALERIMARNALASANRELELPDMAPLIVFVGRLCPGRGLATLLDAFRSVASVWPNARLWLIGEGTGRDELYRRTVDRGIHHRVTMPGSFDDVRGVLRAADLFVSPSGEERSAPLLLEAMAEGLPIVADDLPENRAIVRHAVEGWLAPVGDVAGWSEAMMELLQNHSRARRMGEAAGRRVEADFRLADRVADHLRLFRSLLEEPSSSGDS